MLSRRWYSSGLSPCSATISGVMAGFGLAVHAQLGQTRLLDAVFRAAYSRLRRRVPARHAATHGSVAGRCVFRVHDPICLIEHKDWAG